VLVGFWILYKTESKIMGRHVKWELGSAFSMFLAFGIGAERNMGFEGWGENWDWETYNTNHKKLSSRHTIRKN
jgi:hypothetical protein